ncbi:MAG: hypothetical protein Faunusvirus37_3 [Faunusvirus sp.]|jgi:hypothetical protein|uniref:Uncharacterized protein n=1 Tax=Faunusvirus sp. TaxID=2487766 RepID=A0A3G4ZZG2_9VIRU|nr:MAG: hypothetical protein Faunusvirus37_3 [Faunusvirus sp.]
MSVIFDSVILYIIIVTCYMIIFDKQHENTIYVKYLFAIIIATMIYILFAIMTILQTSIKF